MNNSNRDEEDDMKSKVYFDTGTKIEDDSNTGIENDDVMEIDNDYNEEYIRRGDNDSEYSSQTNSSNEQDGIDVQIMYDSEGGMRNSQWNGWGWWIPSKFGK